MWELNLGFRSAAVLFLTSTCFISLVQPTGHTRGPDTTLGLLYKEQRIVPVSIWKYIKTDSGNIPCHETYEKVAQERHTDITTAEWIPRCKSTSKDLPLFFSDHLTPKETSDSNLSAEQPLIELNKIPFLRDHVSLGTIGSCLEPGWNLTVRLRRRSVL
ncbi:hypothetical protein QVD17_27316 [Tagetes erecta]|uniref:Uncharacterized protein n=1 Tax=Tagetes erecta TaxID=13708 RepID=A0AAD8K878_TARER|nr:hypothetical protein QVD17_27316 [Tagetes erecta]